jgi:hypothetical protein
VITHWNGTAWTRVPSPAPAGLSDEFYGVAAVAADSVWAVGQSAGIGAVGSPLIEHWNGTAWAPVSSPVIPGGGALSAVSASSAGNAWAVGKSSRGSGLIEHWDGMAWSVVPSPAYGMLTGVAADSRSSVWAVGYWTGGSNPTAVIEHWNGTAWTWPAGFCAAPSGGGCYPPGTSSASPLPADTYTVP